MSIILAAGAARMKLEAENYEARISELEAHIRALEAQLADIDNLLDEDQGEDDGAKIMPDFEAGMTTLAKVEACTFLLEKRRDVIEAFEAENARLRERVAELEKAEDAAHDNFISAWEALPGGKYHSLRVVESWLADVMAPAVNRARAARRVREGGKVDG